MEKFEKNQQKIYEKFSTSDIYDLANEIIDSVLDTLNASDNDLDVYDAILDEIDRALIYYSEQWIVIEYYQNPSEADLDRAVDAFIDDLCDCVCEVAR